MKYQTFGLSLLVSTLLFTGCAKPAPVHHDTLSLDLIQSDDVAIKIDKTVIVLKPTLTLLDTKNAQRNDLRSQMIRLQEGLIGGDFNFNEAYQYKYGSTAGNAFKNDISDILRNQGFTVNDEYTEYDDIDFSDRKSAYLVIQPEIEASFITNNVHRDRSGDTITEKGTVSLIGTVKLNDLEPLSKEKISSKKIDLGSLRIEKPYVSIRKVSSRSNGIPGSAFELGQMAGSALGEAMFGSSENDNTEDTLIQVVNTVHKHIITKAAPRLQQGVLLSYVTDIEEIKSKKRY